MLVIIDVVGWQCPQRKRPLISTILPVAIPYVWCMHKRSHGGSISMSHETRMAPESQHTLKTPMIRIWIYFRCHISWDNSFKFGLTQLMLFIVQKKHSQYIVSHCWGTSHHEVRGNNPLRTSDHSHYRDVTWASWCLKSPETRLFVWIIV